MLGAVILLVLSFGSFINAGLGLAFPFVGLGFLGYTFVCGSVTLWM